MLLTIVSGFQALQTIQQRNQLSEKPVSQWKQLHVRSVLVWGDGLKLILWSFGHFQAETTFRTHPLKHRDIWTRGLVTMVTISTVSVHCNDQYLARSHGITKSRDWGNNKTFRRDAINDITESSENIRQSDLYCV